MFRRLLVIAAALLPTICSCAQDIEPGEWMELPEVSDASSLYALSMHMEGRTQRNYSFLWNEERLTADWVAYPLCKGNIGEGNRSNAFGLNPHMPKDMQPLLVRVWASRCDTLYVVSGCTYDGYDGKYRQDMAIPLSELEAATGIVFFPRLKDVVGESLYKKIKSENPRSRQEWR